MQWILKLSGVFEYRPETKKPVKEAVNDFLNSFAHTGLALNRKYDYLELSDGALEISIEAEFEIENSRIRKDDVISEFMEELEYAGESISLDYDVKRKGYKDIENKLYDVEYLIYKQVENGEWHTIPEECIEGPYKQVTVLKVDTQNIIGKYLSAQNCKDGEYLVDATITTNGEWHDSDSFLAVYKGGKVIKIKEA